MILSKICKNSETIKPFPPFFLGTSPNSNSSLINSQKLSHSKNFSSKTFEKFQFRASFQSPVACFFSRQVHFFPRKGSSSPTRVPYLPSESFLQDDDFSPLSVENTTDFFPETVSKGPNVRKRAAILEDSDKNRSKNPGLEPTTKPTSTFSKNFDENYEDSRLKSKPASGYIYAPPKPPTPFVRAILDVLENVPEGVRRNSKELGLVLRDALQKWDGELDVFRVGSILTHVRDPNMALFFHEWACQQEDYRPNIVVYTILVNILARAKATKLLKSLVEEVRTSGLKPTTQFFNRVMRGFADSQESKEALNVYKELEKSGCTPDVHTMRTLIRIYRDLGDFESATGVFEIMKEKGLPPSPRSYGMMIDLCGKVKKPLVAEQLFTDMKDEGLEISTVTYNCLIKALVNCGEVDSAVSVFWGMEDSCCKPDVVTYVSLLNGLRKAWRRDEALEVFGHLQKSDIPASTELYTTVMCLFGELGDLETAESIFQEMGNRGFSPDVFAYSSMMHIYGKAGLLDEALALLEKMKGEGLQPDTWVYSTLIEFLRHSGRFDEAKDMVSMMQTTDGTDKESTYVVRMQGLLDDMKYDEAIQLVEDMKKDGVNAPLRLYTHLLFEYTRCLKQEGVEALVHCMSRMGNPIHRLVVLLQLPDLEEEKLWKEVSEHLDSLKIAPYREGTHRFMDVLLAFLELRGYIAKGVRIWEETKLRRLFHPTITPPEIAEDQKWALHVVHFEPGSALIVVRAELIRLRKIALETDQVFPPWMEIVTGFGSGSRPYGQVGPRERILGFLNRLGSPFDVKIENQGRLEARGANVKEWLCMENVGWALEPMDDKVEQAVA